MGNPNPYVPPLAPPSREYNYRIAREKKEAYDRLIKDVADEVMRRLEDDPRFVRTLPPMDLKTTQ